ncbi:uncharacterized protein TrAtP1_004036 [Trichoderma atroviride]|uniref:uncharacterized protein n=1 Tax=Hypocrea atroviridis TaxID=63577 RepID=UPI00332312DE|nr:hypothetical protein TrAtP1_004036 [Trichoderma atroviride]
MCPSWQGCPKNAQGSPPPPQSSFSVPVKDPCPAGKTPAPSQFNQSLLPMPSASQSFLSRRAGGTKPRRPHRRGEWRLALGPFHLAQDLPSMRTDKGIHRSLGRPLGIINVGRSSRDLRDTDRWMGIFLPAAMGASPGQSAFDDAQEQGHVGGCLIYESVVVLHSLLGAGI